MIEIIIKEAFKPLISYRGRGGMVSGLEQEIDYSWVWIPVVCYIHFGANTFKNGMNPSLSPCPAMVEILKQTGNQSGRKKTEILNLGRWNLLAFEYVVVKKNHEETSNFSYNYRIWMWGQSPHTVEQFNNGKLTMGLICYQAYITKGYW